jgi:hypothetical protein
MGDSISATVSIKLEPRHPFSFLSRQSFLASAQEFIGISHRDHPDMDRSGPEI